MELRDNTQADFDLEKMFELLDEALTSKDERVQSALRGLLTIITLTRTQDDGRMAVETSHGPLRQLQQDVRDMNRRLYNLEDQVRAKTAGVGIGAPINPSPYAGQPYTGQGVSGQPFTTWSGTQASTLWNGK